jgi:hypothetical protein
VHTNWLPLDFEGPIALSLPTLVVVVAAVLAISLVIIGLVAWLPGGWLIGGREEARTRIRASDDEPRCASQAA